MLYYRCGVGWACWLVGFNYNSVAWWWPIVVLVFSSGRIFKSIYRMYRQYILWTCRQFCSTLLFVHFIWFYWKSCEPNFTEEPLGSFDTRYVNRRTNQPFCFKTFDTKAKHKRASARVAIASEPKTTTGRQQYNNDRGNPISSSTSRSFLLYDHLPSASTSSPKFRTEL